ncbi:hypothetical protein JCM8208_005112 [Rhodotorula glutinis]
MLAFSRTSLLALGLLPLLLVLSAFAHAQQQQQIGPSGRSAAVGGRAARGGTGSLSGSSASVLGESVGRRSSQLSWYEDTATQAQVELAEDDKVFSLAHDGCDSTAGASRERSVSVKLRSSSTASSLRFLTTSPTNGRELRPSPTAVKPDLPLFVVQVLVTAGYASGIVRTATARAEAAFNPQHDPATSGVVSFVCKSLGLFVTLLVTAVVVFLASGPGL